VARSGTNKIHVPGINRLVVRAAFDDARLKLRNKFATPFGDKCGANFGNKLGSDGCGCAHMYSNVK
jgi:hypothetical protein